MHLKESAYNFIYDDLGKDQIVFYNSRTGALAVVHEDQYKQYKGFQEKGKEIEDAEFLKNLLKCGYPGKAEAAVRPPTPDKNNPQAVHECPLSG